MLWKRNPRSGRRFLATSPHEHARAFASLPGFSRARGRQPRVVEQVERGEAAQNIAISLSFSNDELLGVVEEGQVTWLHRLRPALANLLRLLEGSWPCVPALQNIEGNLYCSTSFAPASGSDPCGLEGGLQHPLARGTSSCPSCACSS